MTWELVEAFSEGKYGEPARCEDAVVTGSVFAVVDGATDQSGVRFELDGEIVTGGRFVARTVVATLEDIDPCLSHREMADAVTAAVGRAVQSQHPSLPANHRPSASLVVFNPVRDEIWWAGDCRFAVRLPAVIAEPATGKYIDVLNGDMRAAVHEALKASGAAWVPLPGDTDPARAAIQPLLSLQAALQNTTGRFGFGVINGYPIPDQHLHRYDVSNASEVVLASDGYPVLQIAGGLERQRAEEHLAALLAADPLCTRQLVGTHAFRAPLLSYDDRSWLQLCRS